MKRIPAKYLSLSAAALVGLLLSEGYTDKAIIPTKNDVPTLGFGSTIHEDGTRVKMGDTTDPVKAIVKTHSHIEKDERRLRDSIADVPLLQSEYDVFADWIYQYGATNWDSSTIKYRLTVGDYRGACDALLMWRFSGGYDCSTMINGKRNKVCWGVWTRQLERHSKCIEAQEDGHDTD